MSDKNLEKKIETRSFNLESNSLDETTGKFVIKGISAPFNSDSVDYGMYVEQYAKGCFTRTLIEKPDVFALINHDTTLVVGRTTSGNLKLWEDDRGLNYEFTPPDTQMGRDLLLDIKEKRITACSLGFLILKESYQRISDTKYRVLLEDLDLWEMSFVAFPAYPETSAVAEKRSLIESKFNQEEQQLKSKQQAEKEEIEQKRKETLKISTEARKRQILISKI